MDRERPRIEVAVPTDDIEGVVVDDVGLVAAADAYLDQELTLLAVGVQLGRRVDVSVVIRRALEQLAVLVAVAARDLDQAGRLEDEVALGAFGAETVGRAAGDDDVVAVLVGDLAEVGLDRSRALVDEDHLVAFAVSEEVIHRGVRPSERDLHIVVPHQQAPAGDLVATGLHVVRVEEAVRVRVRHPFLALDLLEIAELHHPAWGLEVVEDRPAPPPALQPPYLLAQEPALISELDVPRPR